MFEAALSVGVAAQGRIIVRAAGHRLLERRELALDVDQRPRARKDVLAQREAPLPRRPLIVERDLHVLAQHQLTRVNRRLAGKHPQQGRLPGPIAPGQRHPVTPLERERDAAEQRLTRDVLAEV